MRKLGMCTLVLMIGAGIALAGTGLATFVGALTSIKLNDLTKTKDILGTIIDTILQTGR